jgi:hypothetical protein
MTETNVAQLRPEAKADPTMQRARPDIARNASR